MRCSGSCRWVHQGSGLRPLDALTVSVPDNPASTNLKLTDNCHSSAHFIDPFLRTILESSFIPDDNDLFLTNLVDTPALVIHGCALDLSTSHNRHLIHTRSGVDGNVPTWHSRELVNVLKTWAADAIVRYARFSLGSLVRFHPHGRSFCEEKGEGHWYPSVFKSAQVNAFLDSVLSEERRPHRRSHTFTHTTMVPAETGSLHGWRTLKLLVPGR